MTELHCDDVERLRSALSYMGYATPEGLENCCARQGDLVRDLIRAVLDQKKRRLEGEQVACACGDSYPNYSYGAGFIDAAGHCSNCHASLPAAEDAQGWISVDDKMPNCQQRVLVRYKTIHGTMATTMGWHTPAKTLESSGFEGEVDDEYDEATDTYYMKEQWVDESTESEYHYPISNVTHWMPLPAAPAMSQDSGKEKS